MRRVLVTLLLIMSTMASLAHASSGGPELCEVLGWDPIDRKIFCALDWRSEEGLPRRMVYFAIDGRSPCSMVEVRFPVRTDDPLVRRVGAREAIRRRWRTIVGRLKPLVPAAELTLPSVTIVDADSIAYRGTGGPPALARYRVRLRGLGGVFQGPFDVTTYGTPQVAVPRVYRIPGRREMLAVVSFIGVPIEIGYEAQVPVLISNRCPPPRRVEWKHPGR